MKNEINQINNQELKYSIGETIVSTLLNLKEINESDQKNLSVEFGYLFTTYQNQYEGLIKVNSGEKIFYFAIQNDRLKLINISETEYLSVIEQMQVFHPCLKDLKIISNTENNNYIKSQNISCNENISIDAYNREVKLRELDDICNRIFACFFTTQVVCEINNNSYKEAVLFFKTKLEEFNLTQYLNSKEKRIFDGTYSKQDVIDIDWSYEALCSLLYALGFIEDIKNGGEICDCEFINNLIGYCKSIQEFKNKCKLRNIEDILNKLDLYYKYHWACVEKRINPNISIGNLDNSIVIERRRGLEWLISDVNDWYDINLNT